MDALLSAAPWWQVAVAVLAVELAAVAVVAWRLRRRADEGPQAGGAQHAGGPGEGDDVGRHAVEGAADVAGPAVGRGEGAHAGSPAHGRRGRYG